MKNMKMTFASVAFAVLLVFSFGFTRSNQVTPDKITICHLPPGNPGNCQEITISMNAFQTHMDHHDDALVCKNQQEVAFYTNLANVSKMRLVTSLE